MPLNFVISNKGKNLLKYDGFLYTKQRVNSESVVWKCSLNWKNKCPGKIYTDNDSPNGKFRFFFFWKN